jgi:hypothetical protein
MSGFCAVVKRDEAIIARACRARHSAGQPIRSTRGRYVRAGFAAGRARGLNSFTVRTA